MKKKLIIFIVVSFVISYLLSFILRENKEIGLFIIFVCALYGLYILLRVYKAEGAFKPDESYQNNETEDAGIMRMYSCKANRKSRPYMLFMLFSILIFGIGGMLSVFSRFSQFSPSLFIWIASGLFISYLWIMIDVSIYAFKNRPSKQIRKKYRTFPWRFNNRPFGSEIYKIQERLNYNQEKTHYMYYSIFLPCKHKTYANVSAENIPDEELIEKTFIYLDLKDIARLFELYPRNYIRKVWRENMASRATIFSISM